MDIIILCIAVPFVLLVGLACSLAWLVWQRKYVIILNREEMQAINQWKGKQKKEVGS